MGAEIRTHTLYDASRADALKFLKEWQERDSIERGTDGYSGGIHLCYNGPTVHDLRLPSPLKAADWIADHCDKWACCIVSFVGPTKADERKRKTLEQRQIDAANKHYQLQRQLCDALNQSKSQFIGCKKCGSRLARAYVKNGKCLVCGQTLLSETALKRLETARQKVVTIDKQMDALKNEGKIGWVIGGIAPT